VAGGDRLQLSVVIPTRNRSRSLHNTLASIQAQTLQDTAFETIVVDNGSTDDTRAVCREFQTVLSNLRYRHAAEPGLHEARHAGMRAARSDIIVFTDDDIEAFPGWLAGIDEAFRARDVVLVGGKNLPKFEEVPPQWLARMWQVPKREGRALGHLSILDLGDSPKPIDPNLVWGCNFAIRKEILLAAGGFHPDSMPDSLVRFRGDGETHVTRYVAEKGLKAVYHPRASIFHHVPKCRMTLDYFRRRAFRQGLSDSFTHIRSHRAMPLLSLAVRRIWAQARLLFSRSVRGRLRLAYLCGYLYHQIEVRKDPALMAWVNRPDFLDSEDPSLCGRGEAATA
jgi:glucosyl-dolichyl phosphate glucuronosyltransferase